MLISFASLPLPPPRPPPPRLSVLQAMAQKKGVQIHSHDVIYRFLDDVKAVMSGLLPPSFKETTIGEANTLQVSAWTGFDG